MKGASNVSKFENSNLDSIYFSADHQISGNVTIAIDPEEIILAIQKVQTTARNCIQGRIISIKENDIALEITVLAGEEFNVLITQSALLEFNLMVGSSVFLIFKATAVKLLN